MSIKKILKEYDLIDEVQQSSSEKGRLANKIYLGELSSTSVANSNRPSVKKRLGQVENETPPVSYSAPSETEVSETKYSETESLFIEDFEKKSRNGHISLSSLILLCLSWQDGSDISGRRNGK